ncbi:MAG: phosphatidylserine decarboxylase [Victivallales bacterium]|nr:phosphatidylserine decarboxylase [Victivallales bacterium]
MSSIQLYDRSTKSIVEETVLGDTFVRLAYASPLKHVLSWPLFSHACLSRLMGWYADRPSSIKRIPKTIKELNINMEDYEVPEGGFKSFNDFFTRRLKPHARPFPEERTLFGSPADCRLFAWQNLQNDLCIPVKGDRFTVAQLLGPSHVKLAELFHDGSLCVCRLCPADYHRFHFPDDGRFVATWPVKGKYNSVNPLALNQNLNVFTTNYREISLMNLANFGLTLYIEVGAFAVASITQTSDGPTFKRGEEKGYFSFGGSTIILVFQKNHIHFDQDILEHTEQNIETLVKTGQPIAKSS